MSKRKPSQTRIVHYSTGSKGVPAEAIALLEQAFRDGVVTRYDDGRGFPWWEGPPGPAMRALTKAVRGMARGVL